MTPPASNCTAHSLVYVSVVSIARAASDEPVSEMDAASSGRAFSNGSIGSGTPIQSNIFYSIGGVEQAGQIHGIMANEFYINDNYLVTPEFQMLQTESFVS